MLRLPMTLEHVGVAPIKCQGIKTKLVPFICQSIQWDSGEAGRWIEPFLGSGSVAFNVRPERAVLADANPHIIGLYRAIQSGEITGEAIRNHLETEGRKLEAGGADYYYGVRDRFNREAAPLDFLFLNRSCFNGVMRFNRKGAFNVPFGHKPQRFARAYVTKIVNQVGWVYRQMAGQDWRFVVAPWRETLAQTTAADFVYLDPPYIGRHADYYNAWDAAEAEALARVAQALPGGYALSMWLANRYRTNDHISNCWPDAKLRVCTHFYHVGSEESLRNEMDEALAVKSGYATPDTGKQSYRQVPKDAQLALALERRGRYHVR